MAEVELAEVEMEIREYNDSFVKVVDDDPNAEEIFIDSLGKPERVDESQD